MSDEKNDIDKDESKHPKSTFLGWGWVRVLFNSPSTATEKQNTEFETSKSEAVADELKDIPPNILKEAKDILKVNLNPVGDKPMPIDNTPTPSTDEENIKPKRR